MSSPLLYPCTYSLLLYLLFVSNCACFSFCLNVHLRVFVFCYFVLLLSFLPFWNILSILSLRPCLFFFSQFALFETFTTILLFCSLSFFHFLSKTVTQDNIVIGLDRYLALFLVLHLFHLLISDICIGFKIIQKIKGLSPFFQTLFMDFSVLSFFLLICWRKHKYRRLDPRFGGFRKKVKGIWDQDPILPIFVFTRFRS